jgi:hypothetical protein
MVNAYGTSFGYSGKRCVEIADVYSAPVDIDLGFFTYAYTQAGMENSVPIAPIWTWVRASYPV